MGHQSCHPAMSAFCHEPCPTQRDAFLLGQGQQDGNTACCRGALRNFAASATGPSPRHGRHRGTPGPDTRSTRSQRAAGTAAGRPGRTPPSPAALFHWRLLGDVPTAQDGAEGPSRPRHTEREPLGSIALRPRQGRGSPWAAAGPRSPRRPGGDPETHSRPRRPPATWSWGPRSFLA